MSAFQLIHTVQIRNRPCHPEHPVISSCGQAQAIHRLGHHFLPLRAQGRDFLQHLPLYLGIAPNTFHQPHIGQTLLLALARSRDTRRHDVTAFRSGWQGQVSGTDRWHFYKKIKAIQTV